MFRFNDDLDIAKIRFCMEARSFAFQKSFRLFNTTKRSCWHITIQIGERKRGKILGRIENSRLLNGKAEI